MQINYNEIPHEAIRIATWKKKNSKVTNAGMNLEKLNHS